MTAEGLHIAILSFNRPGYLRQVLESLVTQLKPSDRVYLFQDGVWNPYSKKKKGNPVLIEKAISYFKILVPSGKLFCSTINLGIAGNYRRAEQYLFEVNEAPSALFLEDDMILSPHYLDTTRNLLGIATQCPEIGYVSAYGDFWASIVEQERKSGQLQPMHENWGSALTRDSWIKQFPIRNLYWRLVENSDYQQRDHKAIAALFSEMGYSLNITSQDASRWVACAEAGLVRLTTGTCHARYIGRIGQHFNLDLYKKYGFESAVFYPHCQIVDQPSPQLLHSIRMEQLASLRQGYSHSYCNRNQYNAVPIASIAEFHDNNCEQSTGAPPNSNVKPFVASAAIAAAFHADGGCSTLSGGLR